MKNTIWFLVSFLATVLLMVSCDKVLASPQYFKAPRDGNCYAALVYQSGGSYAGYFILGTDQWWTTGPPTVLKHGSNPDHCGTCNGGSIVLKSYYWNGTSWTYTGSDNRNASSTSVGIIAAGHEYVWAYDGTYGYDLNNYPEAVAPESLDSCGPPPVNCLDVEGDMITGSVTDAEYTAGVFCNEECEMENSGIGIGLRGTGLIIDNFTYTGNAEVTGCADVDQAEELDECDEAQAYCDEACAGIEQDFVCDQVTGEFTCNCDYPAYHRDYDPTTEEMTSDTDEDGLPNNDPTETDMDGDGEPDITDSDPDGDGLTTSDQDSDDDGINNRGKKIWTNDDFGSHNGIGTDGDLDGDGLLNGDPTETDIDGDGIPNSLDPDIDGDGVANGADLDADGDGILDGSDSDADGDGLEGSDDPDADNSGIGEGDTDGDGDVDGDDPPATDPEEWPTEEEIDSGYDGVGDNTYDSTIEGDFTDPDFQGAASDFLDANPLSEDLADSEIQLTNIDSCIDFPNPYNGTTEQFCFNEFETYWNIMGVIMVALTGFMCFRLIAWRY